MLPRAHRITRGDLVTATVRRGRRVATPFATVYFTVGEQDDGPRFAVVVSKKVGNAVVRNRVRRRIRAVCAESLEGIPPGGHIVLRALPGSPEAAWDSLRCEITDGIRRAVVAS